MQSLNLIFPNQLFEDSPLYSNGNLCVLVEHDLFFKQFKFHKQKLAFHRASMQSLKVFLEEKGIQVRYISSFDKASNTQVLFQALNAEGFVHINTYLPS